MSAQLSLTYEPRTVGAETWEAQLKVLRVAVEHLTRKEVAWQLGVTDQALGDALFERDRKRWAARWTHVVKAMLAQRHDDVVAAELLKSLCETEVLATPFVLANPLEWTPEEKAAVERALEKVRKQWRSK